MLFNFFFLIHRKIQTRMMIVTIWLLLMTMTMGRIKTWPTTHRRIQGLICQRIIMHQGKMRVTHPNLNYKVLHKVVNSEYAAFRESPRFFYLYYVIVIIPQTGKDSIYHWPFAFLCHCWTANGSYHLFYALSIFYCGIIQVDKHHVDYSEGFSLNYRSINPNMLMC